MISKKTSHTRQKSLYLISQSDHAGGAAIATNRIFHCLKNAGLRVEWLVGQRSEINDLNIKEINPLMKVLSSLYSKIDWRVCRLIDSNNLELQTSGFFGVLRAKKINELSFDLINIHWIGHGFMSLKQLSKIKKPLILTIHDEWFLHPISHYKNNPASTNVNCLFEFLCNSIKRYILSRKFQILNKDNVFIVCPSKQLASKFRAQFPNKQERILYIPNPVNLNEFYPEKKAQFNGLSAEGIGLPVIFFLGGTKNSRKGFDLLEDALEQIEFPFILLIIGNSARLSYGKFSQIKVVNIRKVYAVEDLRKLYSLSHLVVVPSRDEAGGPQTATEALSCGTPVVGFNTGSLQDIVQSNFTGELVSDFNSTELSKAIMKVLFNKKSQYSDNCRFIAKESFSFEKVRNDYLTLIESKF